MLVACGAFASHPPRAITAGQNPHPIALERSAAAPLSAVAQLGRSVFYDAGLSSSGNLACASCHDPAHAYGPASDAPAMRGGSDLSHQGVRAVPSLMYLDRQPNFSIGPDKEADENTTPTQRIAAGLRAARVRKTARDTAASAANLVPQGGLFWDGRADTLQDQAFGPLLSPIEMDGGNVAIVAAKLVRAPYARGFAQLFGDTILRDPSRLVAEAMFAVARFEIEEPSFHPYTSKFDFWLEGRARLSAAEWRGYRLFNDPTKANCAGCHVDQPDKDGVPPLFTDHQYEALAVPRNMNLAANRDPAYFDLGLCGPYRRELVKHTQYCGFFATPTLRNAATRQVFFHNGVYRTLRQVLDFYDFRDTAPAKIYPPGGDGKIAQYDDVPPRYRSNIDFADPPFDRALGEAPAMSAADEADIIAFLKTLTDGYRPP